MVFMQSLTVLSSLLLFGSLLFAPCFRLAHYYATKSTEDYLDKQSDFAFDGGLKVPMHLWKALYKYQKTGEF